MNPKEKIDLGFASIGGRIFNPCACRCDPDVGAVPCHYCAEHTALEAAEGLERENAALREDKARLDSGVIRLTHWDAFGSQPTLHTQIDLRAAIDAGRAKL